MQRGGEFTPNHQITVLHGLSLAGGFTRFANHDRVVIVRKDARGERRIPFDYSAVVEHGDLQVLLSDCGLDAAGIVRADHQRLDNAGRRPGMAA